MKELRICDMHCDTLLELKRRHLDLNSYQGHINIEKLRNGGAMMQCFAIYVPTFEDMKTYGVTEGAWEYVLSTAKLFEEQMELCSEHISKVTTVEEIEKNRAEGKMSALLTIEDGVGFYGNLERVKQAYELGVRMVALTWNYENSIGFPNSSDPEKHMLGLKEFGFETVAQMERLGMIVDVSHLSEGGFYDVARTLKKPFVASHSCCRALAEHSRNLTDHQLKTLADCGGVCGVNFAARFLRENSELATYDDVMRHVGHMVNVAGVEAVGLGSDFDGIARPTEMKDYLGMERLIELIEKQQGSANAEKILSGNVLRVLKDVIG